MIDRILIVDDDENWCFISKRMLQKATVAHEIIVAKNGLEALNKLQKYAQKGEKLPEVIFLDIKMPVMDGFEFLDELGKLDTLDLQSTRIFICSSSLHPKDQERAASHTVAGFISKPFTSEKLHEILR